MLRWFMRLLVGSPDHREEVEDAVLGVLRPSAEGEWWGCRVEVDGKSIGFNIGGHTVPSPRLIEHAQEIVRSYPKFDSQIRELLATEAARAERGGDDFGRFAANTIRQLVVDEVCLFWPERPDDGMVCFKGSDDNMLWRCDYIDRRPANLGCDT